MRRLAYFSILLAACTAPPSAQPDGRWIEEFGRSIAWSRNGATLWRFHFDRTEPHTFFHPLALPGTPALTVDRPSDHPWHHGLWFGWKFIDGVNYWENAQGAERPAGQSRLGASVIESQPDGSATFRLDVEYAPLDAAPVLAEQRSIAVSTPAADGGYTIDWIGSFEVLAERVVLDRTPLPGEPGGKPYGGYAGLSLRLANFSDREVTTPDGPAGFNEQDRLRVRAPALEYGGTIDGVPFGVAILAHPDNINSPSPWYAIRSPQMTFITPAVLCYGPLEFHRGDRFVLRYRIVVHPGRWEASRLADEARRFARSSVPDAR